MRPTIPSTLLIIALLSCTASATELTPNTLAFNLSKYLYQDPGSASLVSYSAAGFYPKGGLIPGQRVFVLPRIQFDRDRLVFVDKDGRRIKNIDEVSAQNVQHVEIALTYDGNVPNREQSIGIASQLSGTSTPSYGKFVVYDFTKNFSIIDTAINPVFRQQLIDRYKGWTDLYNSQDALYKRWNDAKPEVVAINGLSIKALVDGVAVAERSTRDTVIPDGELPKLYLSNLTPYQINRIKDNGFELEVEYSFKDQKSASIVAHIDFAAMMERIVKESQRRVVSGKSSGFQFLGFGSRKSTMKQAIDESLSDQVTNSRVANTVIQMDDADDQMIQTFNNTFFPEITREQVIEEHLKEADKAASEGKQDLARAHMLFAEDVRNDRPDLRVDTEKALAALKERDYAGFIAHGLKIGSTSNSGNFEYSRVVNIRDNVTDVKDWSYTKNVSLNRTITKLIQVDLQERKPYVGMCDAINVWLNLPLLDPDNMVRMHPGSYFVPTCLLEGGAMLRAGFQPGVLIQRINGRTVNSLNNLEAALDVSPGDTVPVEYLQFVQGPWGPYYEQKTIDVRPGAGAVR